MRHRLLSLVLPSAFLLLAHVFGEDHAAGHAPASKAPAGHGAASSHGAPAASVDPQTAMSRLIAGNDRFVKGKPTHPSQSVERRTELAGGQKPFAIIVGCADSRVPPEVLFDRGLGELFVVRLAGNVMDDAAAGSVEYAVEHLGAKLVVVMGHSACGAVKATAEVSAKGVFPDGPIYSLVAPILPSVAEARGMKGDLVANAIAANAKRQARRLPAVSKAVAKEVAAGRVKVVSAVYDLKSGRVTWL